MSNARQTEVKLSGDMLSKILTVQINNGFEA